MKAENKGVISMKLKTEMLLGFSNRRDAKNDTMVGCKGGGKKRFFRKKRR